MPLPDNLPVGKRVPCNQTGTVHESSQLNQSADTLRQDGANRSFASGV